MSLKIVTNLMLINDTGVVVFVVVATVVVAAAVTAETRKAIVATR